MKLNGNSVREIELEVDAELAESVLDNISANDMSAIFNDEKILERNDDTVWNNRMIERLNENGRKHIKRLYDMVCHWYEANPEDAEAEGYTEW